ncbi:MAG: 3'-5' exonuclease, partial [Paracoccaceae bacterium]|nr:3'-5' exonuclease [Paracoccaceae bacterium]
WPPILKEKDPEPENWFDPVDLVSGQHHAARLGTQVAARIKALIDEGAQIPADNGSRPVHAGDFLILVRRRSDIFGEIIRACKALGLPIAGADRLKLGAELAVKDLASLLAFLATPEDDLALAETLRSPLFGWTEAQLYALAQPRKGYLWEALRNDPGHGQTVEILKDLRDHADYLRPFDLVERALTRHDGRRKLLARLGAEAEDGIDELLSQALVYERNDVPSLTGFLTWLQTDDIEVKRQMDSAGHRIRVMTVHGAKGLEAPIVILPDTADRPYQDKDELIPLPDGRIIWRAPADESPVILAATRAARRAKAEAESLRLLYVAMTRAQSWLIVAAAGSLGSRKEKKSETEAAPAWYDLIEAGLVAAGAVAGRDGGLVHAEGIWPEAAPGQNATAPASLSLPAWASSPAPATLPVIRPLSPSGLGGAKVLPGDSDGDSETAKQRGTDLHLLLEHLPRHAAADWPRIADAMLGDAADKSTLLVEAGAVLRAPALAAIFRADALTEVTLTATLDGQPMLGTIDRLIVEPDRVLVVDYKSNALTPITEDEIPEGLRRQMRAYAVALAQIYPNRRIETAILWTRTAVLMPLTP